MQARKDINEFLNTIPKNVTVVAATKYLNSKEMLDLYSKGVRNFGENRVEAFTEKYEELKDLDIVWHFIGHLQRNKALQVIDKISYLHSLDSLDLAKLISKKATKPVRVFVEVNVNLEESKSGIEVNEVIPFIREIKDLPNIELIGLMTMGRKHDEASALDLTFNTLKELLQTVNLELNLNLTELSMGMSDDYQEAISSGATFVRLGRVLYE